MKLLVALITYNRLEYTKRTIRDFRDTVEVPYYLVVVDNNSSDGTQEYLKGLKKRGIIDKVILNPENYYPGKATNIGWEQGIKDYPNATHLMRLDNDMHLEKGWDITSEEYFKAIPSLGQLGIEHEAIEDPKATGHEVRLGGKVLNRYPGCVGGPNIITRLVWDKGIRYTPMMWNDGRKSPLQEDSRFSKTIQDHGFLMGHMTEKLAWTFANESNWTDYPEYYKKTMAERGYEDRLEKAGL